MNGVRRKRVASAVANLPLFAKGMVVVAIPVAALILILAALAVFLKEKDEAERAVQQTMRVRSAIFNIRSLVADALRSGDRSRDSGRSAHRCEAGLLSWRSSASQNALTSDRCRPTKDPGCGPYGPKREKPRTIQGF